MKSAALDELHAADPVVQQAAAIGIQVAGTPDDELAVALDAIEAGEPVPASVGWRFLGRVAIKVDDVQLSVPLSWLGWLQRSMRQLWPTTRIGELVMAPSFSLLADAPARGQHTFTAMRYANLQIEHPGFNGIITIGDDDE